MIISELKKRIRHLTSPFETMIGLVKENIPFYTEISSTFYAKLPETVASDQHRQQVMSALSQRIFDKDLMTKLASAVDEFAKVKFRMDDFKVADESGKLLDNLKSVADSIQKLLIYHLELLKYRQNDQLPNEDVVKFILKIDQIGIDWDRCLSAYQSYCKLINNVLGTEAENIGALIDIDIQTPYPEPVNAGVVQNATEMLMQAYKLSLRLSGLAEQHSELLIKHFEIDRHIHAGLMVPVNLKENLCKTLETFSANTVVNAAVLKHALEALRLSTGEKISKAQFTKPSNALLASFKKLPAGTYLIIVGESKGSALVQTNPVRSSMREPLSDNPNKASQVATSSQASSTAQVQNSTADNQAQPTAATSSTNENRQAPPQQHPEAQQRQTAPQQPETQQQAPKPVERPRPAIKDTSYFAKLTS